MGKGKGQKVMEFDLATAMTKKECARPPARAPPCARAERFGAERCVTKYVIHVMLADGREWQVARRYSHFRSNHAALSAMFAQLRLPKLPPKVLSMERLSSSSASLCLPTSCSSPLLPTSPPPKGLPNIPCNTLSHLV